MAYLKRQFKTIAVILIPLAIIVFVTVDRGRQAADRAGPNASSGLTFAQSGLFRTLAFIAGCLLSGLTGFIGMSLAVRGNVRTAAAATVRLAARRAQGRVPHRRRRRHVHRRPRPARRHDHHHDLPEHRVRDPHRVRLRWLAARAVPAGRWRHLHQGGRRRRRPRRQGRSRASPRTTPATRPPSPTTWATTSATAPAWPPTSSRATRSRWSRRSSSASPRSSRSA